METKPPRLTEEQQAKLSSNPNIKKVSDKTVQYTPEFKRYVLKAAREGRHIDQLFKDSGIPTEWFPREYARKRMRAWRKLATEHGEEHFDQEQRGSSVRQHSAFERMTDQEKVAHLEMKVEALEYVRRHFQLPPAILWKPHHSRRRRNIK